MAGAKLQGGWNKDTGLLEQRCRVAEQRYGVAGVKTQGGWSEDAGWLERRCRVAGAKMQGG